MMKSSERDEFPATPRSQIALADRQRMSDLQSTTTASTHTAELRASCGFDPHGACPSRQTLRDRKRTVRSEAVDDQHIPAPQRYHTIFQRRHFVICDEEAAVAIRNVRQGVSPARNQFKRTTVFIDVIKRNPASKSNGTAPDSIGGWANNVLVPSMAGS